VFLGWPMLLMPVHVLFLQLIIDPACSVVFEAEPLEPGAMQAPPRRPDARLFDASVLVRGLWQGTGLLVMLLAVYALTRSPANSDQVARALTFSVLVVSNLGLIFANRFWHQMALPGRGPSNAAFRWIAIAALALLASVLGIPAVSRLFAFETPTVPLLLAGLVAAGLGLLWFEAVKWGLGRRRSHAA
jgi:P-type Ca2+ transporter type 2C